MLGQTLFTVRFAAMALALPYQQGYIPTVRPMGLQRFALSEPSANVDPLMKDIQGLNDNLKELNRAFETFSGRAEEALSIEGASDKVYSSMDRIIKQIQSGPQLTLLEAANVGTAFLDFLPNTAKTIGSFVSKKQLFEQLGLLPVVIQELKRQKDQSEALDKAMVEKVPEIAKDEAKDIYGDVQKSFETVISGLSTGSEAEFGSGKESSAEELEGSS
jgi:hypothetical protein